LENSIADQETFAGPSILVIEVAGASARRTGDAALGLFGSQDLFRIPGFRVFPLSSIVAGDAALLAANLRLRGADAVFVATARQMGLALVTLDQEILTRAATTIEVFAPP